MNQLWLIGGIAVAGAVGALTRYGVSTLGKQLLGDSFPFGTLIVNVAGCFLLGLVAFLSMDRIPESWRLVVGVGFLGALTTFSTFGVETFTLWENGQIGLVAWNIGSNLVFGLMAVFAGVQLARWLDVPVVS